MFSFALLYVLLYSLFKSNSLSRFQFPALSGSLRTRLLLPSAPVAYRFDRQPTVSQDRSTKPYAAPAIPETTFMPTAMSSRSCVAASHSLALCTVPSALDSPSTSSDKSMSMDAMPFLPNDRGPLLPVSLGLFFHAQYEPVAAKIRRFYNGIRAILRTMYGREEHNSFAPTGLGPTGHRYNAWDSGLLFIVLFLGALFLLFDVPIFLMFYRRRRALNVSTDCEALTIPLISGTAPLPLPRLVKRLRRRDTRLPPIAVHFPRHSSQQLTLIGSSLTTSLHVGDVFPADIDEVKAQGFAGSKSESALDMTFRDSVPGLSWSASESSTSLNELLAGHTSTRHPSRAFTYMPAWGPQIFEGSTSTVSDDFPIFQRRSPMPKRFSGNTFLQYSEDIEIAEGDACSSTVNPHQVSPTGIESLSDSTNDTSNADDWALESFNATEQPLAREGPLLAQASSSDSVTFETPYENRPPEFELITSSFGTIGTSPCESECAMPCSPSPARSRNYGVRVSRGPSQSVPSSPISTPAGRGLAISASDLLLFPREDVSIRLNKGPAAMDTPSEAIESGLRSYGSLDGQRVDTFRQNSDPVTVSSPSRSLTRSSHFARAHPSRIPVSLRLQALVTPDKPQALRHAKLQAKAMSAPRRYSSSSYAMSMASHMRAESHLPDMRRDFQYRAAVSGISVARGDALPTPHLQSDDVFQD